MTMVLIHFQHTYLKQENFLDFPNLPFSMNYSLE